MSQEAKARELVEWLNANGALTLTAPDPGGLFLAALSEAHAQGRAEGKRKWLLEARLLVLRAGADLKRTWAEARGLTMEQAKPVWEAMEALTAHVADEIAALAEKHDER